MNKILVLFVVLFACAIVYFRGYGPASPKNNAAPVVTTEKTKSESSESVQQSLPDDAKNLTVQIKNTDKDTEFEKNEEDIRQREEAEMREMERQSQAYLAASKTPDREIVFLFKEPPSTLKWPCTTATYSEITNSYGYVWGKGSPDPQDSVWNKMLQEDLIDYSLCRAIELSYTDICLSMEFLAEARNDRELRDYISINCKNMIVNMQPILYSLGKATHEECMQFAGAEKNNSRVCDEIKKHRGMSFCKALNTSGKDREDCLSFFPAKKSDCDSLSGKAAKRCSDNLLFTEAVSAGDINKCPKTGRIGIMCRAYLSKTVDPDKKDSVCKSVWTKLNNDFCSGGKYAKTRRPNLK